MDRDLISSSTPSCQADVEPLLFTVAPSIHNTIRSFLIKGSTLPGHKPYRRSN